MMVMVQATYAKRRGRHRRAWVIGAVNGHACRSRRSSCGFASGRRNRKRKAGVSIAVGPERVRAHLWALENAVTLDMAGGGVYAAGGLL